MELSHFSTLAQPRSGSNVWFQFDSDIEVAMVGPIHDEDGPLELLKANTATSFRHEDRSYWVSF